MRDTQTLSFGSAGRTPQAYINLQIKPRHLGKRYAGTGLFLECKFAFAPGRCLKRLSPVSKNTPLRACASFKTAWPNVGLDAPRCLLSASVKDVFNINYLPHKDIARTSPAPNFTAGQAEQHWVTPPVMFCGGNCFPGTSLIYMSCYITKCVMVCVCKQLSRNEAAKVIIGICLPHFFYLLVFFLPYPKAWCSCEKEQSAVGWLVVLQRVQLTHKPSANHLHQWLFSLWFQLALCVHLFIYTLFYSYLIASFHLLAQQWHAFGPKLPSMSSVIEIIELN